MGESLEHNEDDDTIYVAVSQDVRESKSTLLWTLRHFQVKKLCLLHVHLTFSLTASSTGLEQSEINAIQESELRTSYDSLYKYRGICTSKGVNEEDVDISVISGYGVGEGIVELIYQNNIKKLVIGAAADPHYSRGMSITSRKAEYVNRHAPRCCKMWFICKGKLIKTREGSFDHVNPPGSSSEGWVQETKDATNKLRKEPSSKLNSKGREEDAPNKVRKVPSSKLNSKGREEDSSPSPSPSPPGEYLCPITMEIMKDPQVAADGFTYEAEAIRKHIGRGGGRKNSPMTLKPLENHNLVPNRALGILIKDWLEKHPNYID